MQNYTSAKVRKGRPIKTFHSNYLFHLHQAPQATQAKADLLCEAQRQENQFGIERIKIKLLTKSLQNFEPWQIERKSSFESEPKQKVMVVKKQAGPSNLLNRRSLTVGRERQYLKSQISLDKIKKCTFLKFEGKAEAQRTNKRYHKNGENKTAASSFYSLRKMKDCNSTLTHHKFSTQRSLSAQQENKIILSQTIRSKVKSKRKFSDHSDIIQIEHPLTNCTKIQRQMMGSTLRKKIPKYRSSNILSLKNTSTNLCQAILIKKSEPIQKQIGKILKLLSQQKSMTGLL